MSLAERQREITRLREENKVALAAPRMMDGAISATQINRMSKRQYEKWQSDVQKGFEVRAIIADLSRSDEEIAAEIEAKEKAQRKAKREAAERYVEMVKGLGSMAHLKNGKLKKGYQVAVNAMLKQIEENREV